MSRLLTVKNIYDKKHETFELSEPWSTVLGEIEKNGLWLIWGAEKNGKTWLALQLANYLSTIQQILYISAEEGVGHAFVESCKRAKIESKNKMLKMSEYLTIDELREKLDKRRSADIVFIDNITVYNDELKNGQMRKLLNDYSSKLFIFLAHEDRGEPYTATAKLARRLAKVIVHVRGLACTFAGRIPGGVLTINEEKAKLFYDNNIAVNNEQ
jgi:hypothetical protein